MLTRYKRVRVAANAVIVLKNFFKFSPPLRRIINLPPDGENIMTIIFFYGIKWKITPHFRVFRAEMTIFSKNGIKLQTGRSVKYAAACSIFKFFVICFYKIFVVL